MAISLFNKNLNNLTKVKVQKLLALSLDYYKKKDFLIASKYLKQIITLDNNNSDAFHYLGLIFYHYKDYDEALINMNISISKNNKNKLFYINLGNLHDELNNFQEAITAYNLAIKLDYKYSEAYYNLGLVYQKLLEFKFSIENFSKAILYNNKMLEAYIGMGNSYQELGNFELSMSCYNDAIKIDQNNFLSYFNKGVLNNKLFQYDAAIKDFNIAINLNNNIPELHFNLAYSFYCKRDYFNAIICYENSISLNTNYALAYCNAGNVYKDTNEYDKSIEYYLKAIEIDSDYLEPLYNLGILYSLKNEIEKSLHYFSILYSKNKRFKYLDGSILSAKLQICYWDKYSLELNNILASVTNNQLAVEPFQFLALSDSIELQRLVAEKWVSEFFNYNNTLNFFTDDTNLKSINDEKKCNQNKIKIAFLSADFGEHPMGYNFVGFFENLDKEKFEIIGVSFIKVSNSTLSQRLVAAFDVFKIVANISDSEVCMWIKEQNVDIAVDMMGPTLNNRQGIFAMRCAPIQVNQFSWTSGSKYMDYIIADPVSMPEKYAYGYSEKFAYVPNTLFATDDKRQIEERIPLRSEEYLPDDAIVLCCFNNSFKITPEIFGVWMRVLQRESSTVLWMRSAGSSMEINLREVADTYGVDPKRLVFAKRVPCMATHLARYRLADLFLDTFPFCAQTTASDALWAGIPVVTCVGFSSMSRICASMLTTLEMTELVTKTLHEYEQKIIEICQDKQLLIYLRNRLSHQKQVTPLFNTALYTRNIENAYFQMYKNYINNIEYFK